MATSTVRRLYWDACVFLSYINGVPDRIGTLDKLMAEGSQGKIEIVTSAISMVEVAFGLLEQKGKALDVAVEAAIDKLWMATAFIKIVEFHPFIAKHARALIREGIPKGWSGLRAHDAIHLATASTTSASGLTIDEFNTYNLEDMERYSPSIKMPVRQPYVLEPELGFPPSA